MLNSPSVTEINNVHRIRRLWMGSVNVGKGLLRLVEAVGSNVCPMGILMSRDSVSVCLGIGLFLLGLVWKITLLADVITPIKYNFPMGNADANKASIALTKTLAKLTAHFLTKPGTAEHVIASQDSPAHDKTNASHQSTADKIRYSKEASVSARMVLLRVSLIPVFHKLCAKPTK